MARIELKNLAHSYLAKPRSSADYALRKMDHIWKDGHAYALLGPSGCGKTTLLNIISGLLQPSEGKVLFDDKDVSALLPQERNIAQVFQFPVIYDTMTVFDNLAFPLRNRKVPSAEVDERVKEVSEMLELDDVLHKRAVAFVFQLFGAIMKRAFTVFEHLKRSPQGCDIATCHTFAFQANKIKAV